MNKDFFEQDKQEFLAVLSFVSITLIGKGTKNKYYYITQAKNIQEHFGNMFFRKYYNLPNTATSDEINNCIQRTLYVACEVKENELFTQDEIKELVQKQAKAIENEYYKQKKEEFLKYREEAIKSMLEYKPTIKGKGWEIKK